jgi:hypothetical protein
MSRIKTGLIAGLAFGILDIIPMMFMDLPDRNIAMIGAFLNRFAIGFLIPNTTLPLPGWLAGLLIALLLSLPDAIITGAYAPILGLGMVGGVVIGFLVNRKKVAIS